MTTSATEDRPDFIYGTAWKEEETARLTRLALKCGFRAIDTANQRKHYYEAGVGEAIDAALEEGDVERDELFVQTKFTFATGQDHRMPYDAEAAYGEQVEQSFASSLEHLGLERLDSYVLHGPSQRSGLGEPDREVWRTMEELVQTEQLDAIGVSNVLPQQLETLIEWADHPPAFVQNRCFARTGWDREVRAICDAHDISYQAFSLLTANERALRSETIRSIAERHDRTIPQVVFRFAMEVGMIPLTGTTDEEHMRRDLDCTAFELGDEDVEAIEGLAVE